jgi:hypothetical protein
MKELKNLTYSNIKTEGNIKYKINSYYDDRKKITIIIIYIVIIILVIQE